MTQVSARSLSARADQDADVQIDAVLRPDPADVEGAVALLRGIDLLVGSRRFGRLIGPDGDSVEIPASVLAAFRLVAAAMAQGQAVTVAPHDLELTTQEAADLLHVSRTHLVKLLDQGDLPHHRTSDDPNAHRRVLLKDVLSYRDQRRRTRRDLLREITQISQGAEGGYR
jgi:excisionase family DNA binding protein